MPVMSFIMDGVAYDTDETTTWDNQDITFTNEGTGESIVTQTGDNGVFIFDLANFPSGWSNGDVISFTVGGNSNRGEYIKIRAISHNTSQIKFTKMIVEEES